MILFASVLGLLPLKSVAADSRPTINIGWIGPLTGDAAFLGVDSAQIVRDRFEEINGGATDFGQLPFRLVLKTQDDQYSTSKALSAYTKLYNTDDVRIFIALTYGAVVSFSERFAKDDVVVINPLDCDQEIAELADNIFCVAKTTEQVGEVLAKEALRRGVSQPAVLYAQKDPFAPKVAASVRSVFKDAGKAASLSQGISDESGDFRDVLARIRTRKSDALFVLGYDDFGLALKQARQFGIKAPFFSFASITSPGFKALAGKAIEGTVVAGWFAPRTPQYENFIAGYKAKYGRDLLLEVGSVPSYDVANLIATSLSKQDEVGEGTVNVGAFKQSFYDIKGYEGLSGVITMDPDGAVRTLKGDVKIYENGALREIAE